MQKKPQEMDKQQKGFTRALEHDKGYREQR